MAKKKPPERRCPPHHPQGQKKKEPTSNPKKLNEYKWCAWCRQWIHTGSITWH